MRMASLIQTDFLGDTGPTPPQLGGIVSSHQEQGVWVYLDTAFFTFILGHLAHLTLCVMRADATMNPLISEFHTWRVVSRPGAGQAGFFW